MDRRKFLVGLGGTALGGSALIGTGAFSRIEAQRGVTIQVAEDPDAYLGLDKCDTPNGSYAWLDDDGHLEILMNPDNPTHNGDIDDFLGAGINSDSLSWFHNVFQICNQGKQSACVWIEDSEDWPEVEQDDDPDQDLSDYVGQRRVDFYLGDEDTRSIIGERNAITLDVGDCVCIGIKTVSKGLSEGDVLLEDLENEIRLIADVDCFEDPRCVEEEVLYLTNSRPKDDNGDEIQPGLDLLEVVNLDGGVAELDLLQRFTDPNFNQVDSLACTPDGDTIYLYDKDSGRLGEVDPTDPGAGINDLGEVDNDPGEVVLGAYSPDGVLYAVSQVDNKLYEVNPTVPEAIEVGDTGIGVSGSDIVFDVDTMFLHSNTTEELYEVDRNTGAATPICDLGESLTGLAIRAGGTGDILGSVSGFPGGMSPGQIVQFDRSDCTITDTFDMELDGEDYDYESGDMATGPRCIPLN